MQAVGLILTGTHVNIIKGFQFTFFVIIIFRKGVLFHLLTGIFSI
jgi:hypothetical protein